MACTLICATIYKRIIYVYKDNITCMCSGHHQVLLLSLSPFALKDAYLQEALAQSTFDRV